MKISRAGALVAVLTTAALGLGACAADEAPTPPSGSGSAGGAGSEAPADTQLSGTLTGGGASSQESAMTAWTQAYASTQPSVTVQYNPVGSGGGREGFLAGQYSFAGSDSVMDEEELTQSQEVCGPDGAFHVPAYISPIAVAFNLPGVDSLNLDADTIASIFKGDIATWDDDAIASQNEGTELPDTPISVVHRSDDSGTTENFTDYLSVAAPDVWTYEAGDVWPSEEAAENAQGTSGVVSLTSQTEGAITYADASAAGELGTVAVQVGEEYVEYSAEAASKAVETAERIGGGAEQDMAVELDRATEEAGTYPIVLVSYHIYCTTYADQETVDLIKSFGEFAVSAEGQEAASAAAGNAPLSSTLAEEATAAIESITVQ
ncbi:phosphate ABC transporter substrate-binding protein PstS [Auraticoccus monumenti]|uniref:Phosphate-binding protein n=1 Tax=Auraticoccus monumenti TaxID=675864 RepID=A0A1G7F2N2_9ACTN|nr:phosphate ABC transporter substrate-binding protein PstS [Auraticoccus monumenti]SDE70157.1 phosphate transport system substrate-binding protein [Auraticoccus monumenti]